MSDPADVLKAAELIGAAQKLLEGRPLASGARPPCAESIDDALAHTLEAISGLMSESSGPKEPYEEIGQEPLSQAEAILLLPAFLERCRELLGTDGPYPCTCIATRAQTFAFYLVQEDDNRPG
ncbi:MAG TPA: hypothetical protein VGJ16_14530 [Pirellulales bacterium]|jgi:hypothetical protein